jgi:hypothetical protein
MKHNTIPLRHTLSQNPSLIGQYITFWVSDDEQKEMELGHGKTSMDSINSANEEAYQNHIDIDSGTLETLLCVAD